MGLYENLKGKCAGGVGPDCSQEEYNQFMYMDQYGSDSTNPPDKGGLWFDRILGGISDLSGVVFGIYDRATGNNQPGYQGYPGYGGYGGDVPKKDNTLIWVIVIMGLFFLIGGIVLVIALRKNRGVTAAAKAAAKG